MEYIYTPWKNRLIEDLKSATKEVFLVSPFIKSSVARDIYAILLNKGIKVRTISRFAKAEFLSGASDIEAHFMLSGNGSTSTNTHELRVLSHVHAKIFIIDDKIAYVGSSNLTFSGLLKNFEGTVRLDDQNDIAPLQQRMNDLWDSLRTVDRDDFLAMLPQLSEGKQGRRSEEADHLYNIKTAIDDDSGIEANSHILRESIKQRYWVPISQITLPSISSLITEAVTQEPSSTAELTNEEETPETRNIRLTTERIAQHIKITKHFLSQLSNRFNIDVQRNPNLYASALRTGSIYKFWKPEYCSIESFENVDPLYLYGDEDADIDVLGYNVFNLCVAHIAVKVGIVQQFGIGISSMFVAKAGQLEIFQSLWDQNLLGSVLTSFSLDSENNIKVRQRLISTALRRLIAAIYIEEGLIRTLEIVEEYFNPTDIIGLDIVSLIDLEGPKTTLVQICQKFSLPLPQYGKANSVGEHHDATWETTIEVGEKINARGLGSTVQESSNNAARAALDELSKQKSGAKILIDYRNDLIETACKPSQPLFPKTRIDENTIRRVRDQFANLYQLQIKPSLGFASCIDQENRKMLKLTYSNSTMAWFGSYLIQVFTSEVAELRQASLAVGVIDSLYAELNISKLRANVGITMAAVEPQQIIQALATALYFSNAYEPVRDLFVRIIKLIQPETIKHSSKGHMTRPELATLLNKYDAAIAYPTILQELIQSKTTELPQYIINVRSKIPSAVDAIEVTSTWKDFQVKALGPNKMVGRNKCAYEMLKRLATLDDFWEDSADHIDLPK